MNNITIKWLILTIFGFLLFGTKLCEFYLKRKQYHYRTNIIRYIDFSLTLLLIIMGISIGFSYNKDKDIFDIISITTLFMAFVLTSKQLLPFYSKENIPERKVRFLNRMHILFLMLGIFYILMMIM